MRVVKLKRGYRISLSDTEMNVLRSLVSEGEGGIVATNDMDGWSSREKTAYTKRTVGGGFLDTDENRR